MSLSSIFRQFFLWAVPVLLLVPVSVLLAQPATLAGDVHAALLGSSPSGRYVVLYFSDNNCTACFLEYQNFWKDYIRQHRDVSVIGCLITDRPYIRETLLKEYDIDIPVHTIQRRIFDSAAPMAQLPRAVVYQSTAGILLEHHMGERDSLVSGDDGYLLLERRLNELLVDGMEGSPAVAYTAAAVRPAGGAPPAGRGMRKIDAVRLSEEGDDVILGIPQIDPLPGGGYAVVDYKRARLYFYAPDGTISSRVDFKDSAFIGSRILNLHYVTVRGDTLFCMGTIPRLLKRGADSTKDEYALQPAVYLLRGGKALAKVTLEGESLLPPLRMIGSAIIAKSLPWSAMNDIDSLRALQPVVAVGFDNRLVRRFGRLDVKALEGKNPMSFVENAIVLGADSVIYYLDQSRGTLQRFTAAGNPIDFLDLFAGSNVAGFFHTHLLADAAGTFHILSYDPATKGSFLSTFGRTGKARTLLAPVPEGTISLVGIAGDGDLLLGTKGEEGIFVERWSTESGGGR